jgi:hypothetical protein
MHPGPSRILRLLIALALGALVLAIASCGFHTALDVNSDRGAATPSTQRSATGPATVTATVTVWP